MCSVVDFVDGDCEVEQEVQYQVSTKLNCHEDNKQHPEDFKSDILQLFENRSVAVYSNSRTDIKSQQNLFFDRLNALFFIGWGVFIRYLV